MIHAAKFYAVRLVRLSVHFRRMVRFDRVNAGCYS